MELSEPWALALELAWESMLAETTPVGAVVIDGNGQVVTQGRGRRLERHSVNGELSYSHLAHAELNALAQLPPTQRYEGLTVLTTLEPCVLCMGAAIMATVGRIEFAGADPYGGASHLQLQNAHTKLLMPRVFGPEPGPLGVTGAALHYAFYLERNPDGPVVAAYQQQMPEFVKQIDESGMTVQMLQYKAEKRGFSELLSLVV